MPILAKFGAASPDRVPRSWMRLQPLPLARRLLLSCKFLCLGLRIRNELRNPDRGHRHRLRPPRPRRSTAATCPLHLRIFGALVGREKLEDRSVRLRAGQGRFAQ